MIKSFGQAVQRLFLLWAYRRVPPSNSISLGNSNLFIFPTKVGFNFFLLILLCWLVATNYENNVVFAITCLLTALFLVGILHSFINMSGLSITFVHATPVFTGETLSVEVMLSQKHARYRNGLRFSFDGGEITTASIQGKENVRVRLSVLAPKRGHYNPGRLKVESVYPLGLLRVWTKIDLNINCLVYPRPIFGSHEHLNTSGRGEGALQHDEGSEDFVGLKHYQPGDSLKRIAWKQYAREQGLYAKHYADYQDERIWLDWDALPGLDRESRLSVLTGKLRKIAVTNQHYGLRLPAIEIAPDSGETHKLRLLTELALFESPSHTNEGVGSKRTNERKPTKPRTDKAVS
tara:strand:+ start:19207 stop:20250 length:1044 start_codon:yes stop_codon:yes gene_type:complete